MVLGGPQGDRLQVAPCDGGFRCGPRCGGRIRGGRSGNERGDLHKEYDGMCEQAGGPLRFRQGRCGSHNSSRASLQRSAVAKACTRCPRRHDARRAYRPGGAACGAPAREWPRPARCRQRCVQHHGALCADPSDRPMGARRGGEDFCRCGAACTASRHRYAPR